MTTRKIIFESDEMNCEWISLGKFCEYLDGRCGCVVMYDNFEDEPTEMFRGQIKDIPNHMRCMGMVQMTYIIEFNMYGLFVTM